MESVFNGFVGKTPADERERSRISRLAATRSRSYHKATTFYLSQAKAAKRNHWQISQKAADPHTDLSQMRYIGARGTVNVEGPIIQRIQELTAGMHKQVTRIVAPKEMMQESKT